MTKALIWSTRLVEIVLGPPSRGLVHSVFASAANLCFNGQRFLSLNAAPASHQSILEQKRSDLPLLPNGVLLSASASESLFQRLRPGMWVVLGAGTLLFETADVFDLGRCQRWNPHIIRPAYIERAMLQTNYRVLARFCQRQNRQSIAGSPEPGKLSILELAEHLCGRGPGLTPGGDDWLVGWMSAGWLLYGPQSDFLKWCQSIVELAQKRTHPLSQCWLACAAEGDVSWPVHALLTALTAADSANLEQAASDLAAIGASSGFELLQGLLYSLATLLDETNQEKCRAK